MTKRGQVKSNIITSAIRLFNEHGVHAISSNHIISDVDISPGTFYYHFKNKEEVIQEIFLRISEDFPMIQPEMKKLDSSEKNVRFIFEEIYQYFEILVKNYYDYRFFYLDLAYLLKRDASLRKAYQKNYTQKIENQFELFQFLQKQKIIKTDLSDRQLKKIINNIWIVSDFWIAFLHARGEKISKKNITEVIEQIESIINSILIK